MSLRCWLAPTSARVYPSTKPARRALRVLDVARNEAFSFQVCLRHDGDAPLPVRLEATGPRGWRVRLRRVGYVPLPHHNAPIPRSRADVAGRGLVPGYVPDPLFDEHAVDLMGGETHAFWISVRPGRNAAPGRHAIAVTVVPETGRKQGLSAPVRLHPVTLCRRKGFGVTHWFYADALIDWYQTDLFDKRFWQVAAPYFKNMAEHGQNMVYVPVFTPPLDGVKRPTQLLRVRREGKDRYRFDWRDVRTYIRTAKRAGLTHFEWCHPFTQWGVANAIRIYEGQGVDERLLWKPSTRATSATYRAFLGQYLPRLQRFCADEGILKKSLFHVSDEPHGTAHRANYRKARALLKELAPWMQVADALSEVEFGRQGLTDMPIPSIKTALQFHREGIPSWCYYCCGPRGQYLNRLLDTPLAKIAMHGLLFYRWPFQGFLHWGYNYWYRSQTRDLIDPFAVHDGGAAAQGWAYGDTFVVYPGPEGPLDSIRWEIFGESLQDYQLLQALDLDRDHALLRPIKDFAHFPKMATWRRDLRYTLLQMAT